MNSTADVQAFLQKHRVTSSSARTDRDSVLAAREEVLTRLAEVGEISEPIMDGRMTGHSQRPIRPVSAHAFWKSVSPLVRSCVRSLMGRRHMLWWQPKAVRPLEPTT